MSLNNLCLIWLFTHLYKNSTACLPIIPWISLVKETQKAQWLLQPHLSKDGMLILLHLWHSQRNIPEFLCINRQEDYCTFTEESFSKVQPITLSRLIYIVQNEKVNQYYISTLHTVSMHITGHFIELEVLHQIQLSQQKWDLGNLISWNKLQIYQFLPSLLKIKVNKNYKYQ